MGVGLDDIRRAAERIRGRVLRTPLRRSEWLSTADRSVHFKLEAIQPTCSYKIRGAFNAVLRLRTGDPAALPAALVTASAGNHGRALAHAARIAGLPLTVYASQHAPRVKIEAMRAEGADLRLCTDYDEAERRAKAHGPRRAFARPRSRRRDS